jgi:hypothetical protein
MIPAALEPRRHAPPPDWPVEVFELVTDVIAAMLLAAMRRARDEETLDPVGRRGVMESSAR